MIKTNFLGNEMPNNVHYASIACININSVVRMGKNDYPQAYLEEYK